MTPDGRPIIWRVRDLVRDILHLDPTQSDGHLLRLRESLRDYVDRGVYDVPLEAYELTDDEAFGRLINR